MVNTFANTKINNTFVSEYARLESKFEECGFFMHKNQHTDTNVLGYLIPVYYRFFGTVIEFGDSGKDSLSFLYLLTNFYTQMPNSVKIRTCVNNSNATSTHHKAKHLTIILGYLIPVYYRKNKSFH